VAAVLNSGGKESKDLVMLYSPRELERAVEMGRKVATGAVEKVEPADVFSRPGSDAMSADVALWGRMLAVEPTFNVMAACSVAHAMTTHRAVIEDDYFTAVDDLNPNGAGHLSARQFTSGVFYNYVTVNMDLLHSNLGDDEALVEKTIRGLIRAACTVSPTGMKSSFASYSQAAFALLEIGSAAPRSLASAFVRPVYGQDQIADSIKALRTFRKSLDAIYGPQSHASTEVDVTTGRGTLDDLVALATGRAVAHTEAAE
jgi:CRISPR system Cascade subunit CasC